jgi:hypothetical protein
MLHSVPKDISKGARAVVLRHPNSMECAVFRKKILRGSEGEMGRMPTLGGLGVLSSEDESEVDWEDLGYGMLLFTEQFQSSSFVDRDDSLDSSYPQRIALIEMDAEPGTPEHHIVERNDIVYLLLHDEVKIAYEVIDVEGSVDISPYTRRYVVQKRDALTYIGGFPD